MKDNWQRNAPSQKHMHCKTSRETEIPQKFRQPEPFRSAYSDENPDSSGRHRFEQHFPPENTARKGQQEEQATWSQSDEAASFGASAIAWYDTSVSYKMQSQSTGSPLTAPQEAAGSTKTDLQAESRTGKELLPSRSEKRFRSFHRFFGVSVSLPWLSPFPGISVYAEILFPV